MVAAHKAGLAPRAIFLPAEDLIIAELIDDATTYDNPMIHGSIPDCVEAIKTLHSIDPADYTPFQFDVGAICDHYLAVSEGHKAPLPDDIQFLFEQGQLARDVLSTGMFSDLAKVPTHNDLLCANWVRGHIRGPEKLWLIDFEYAGMGDRFFDLANFSVNCELSNEMDVQLLTLYFGTSPTPAHIARLELNKTLSDLREGLWSYVQWGVSKTCEPAFYADYGDKMLARYRANIAKPSFATNIAQCAKPEPGKV